MLDIAHCTAAIADSASFPWMPVAPGMSSKPLAFLPDNAGWAVLLKVEPATRIGLHRHLGAVHGLVLSGRRRLGDGRVLGPGDYEFEPAGQTDTWAVEGDEALVSFFVVCGPVEYFGPGGEVVHRDTAAARPRSIAASAPRTASSRRPSRVDRRRAALPQRGGAPRPLDPGPKRL